MVCFKTKNIKNAKKNIISIFVKIKTYYLQNKIKYLYVKAKSLR